MIIKAPVANRLAQHQCLRRTSRIRNMRHHTVTDRETIRGKVPTCAFCANANNRPLAIYKHRAGTKNEPMPDTLTLNLRIKTEGRGNGRREPHVDEVAIFITGKTQ